MIGVIWGSPLAYTTARMTTLVAKVVRVSDVGEPLVQLVDGFVQPAGIQLAKLEPDVGEIVLYSDNEWTLGADADWHPHREVGVVQHVSGGRVVVATAHGQSTLAVPDGLYVETGKTIEFDAREEVLGVIADGPITPEPLRVDRDDDFDPSSLMEPLDPTLSWEQFAGFETLRRDAQDMVAVQMRRDPRERLRRLGVRPIQGILFEGPPGTGKTMLAQIMAKEAGAAFYLVTAASLGGHLQGESEGRLEAVYNHAAGHDVAIVFVDEIDTLMKDRGSEDNYGTRLVHVFLTNMDGARKRPNVITIGTTNRAQDIDNALRRPGRFSRELHFERPDFDGRLAILTAPGHVTSDDLDYGRAAKATEGWSAADLQSVWEHAGELAVQAGRTAIRNDHFLAGLDRARQRKAEQETEPS